MAHDPLPHPAISEAPAMIDMWRKWRDDMDFPHWSWREELPGIIGCVYAALVFCMMLEVHIWLNHIGKKFIK